MPSLEFFEAVSGSSDGSNLVVQYTHEHSSWVSLPPQLCTRLLNQGAPTPLVLELRPLLRRAGVSLPSDPPCYVAWAGAATDARDCVGLPIGLGRVLGLAQGASVVVRPLVQAAAALSVSVEPASEDDWEVVELNAGYLEEQLLNQVGVASLQQPLLAWIRSLAVQLRVVDMQPAGPVARLVRGTEIYVAPRLRVRPSVGGAAAAGGVLLPPPQQAGSTAAGVGTKAAGGQQQQDGQQHGRAGREGAEDGEEEEWAAAAPLQAVLRVQPISSRVASNPQASTSAGSPPLAALAGQEQQAQSQQLPPSVQLVLCCAATLVQCGLRPGDWVRLAGRSTRSLVKFASLAASELAAPGHLALTAEQSEWAGAPPFSHIRLQRLTRAQRELIVEAAELQRATAAVAGSSCTTGSSRATLGGLLGRPANGGSLQQQQQQQQAGQAQHLEDAAGQAGQQEDGEMTEGGAALAGASWLKPAAEQALQHLLPILGFGPRSLLQSWGAPRPGGLLVCGPAGSGKSALLATAAAALQQHPDCLTYSVVVSCREISAEGASQAQAQILPKVQEALEHLPSLLIFDDLDVLCPAEAAGADGAAATADPALVAWLCDLLDHLSHPSPDWGRLPAPGLVEAGSGLRAGPAVGTGAGAALQPGRGAALGPALWPPLAVAATCRDAAALAAPLRAAGRLDHPVTLPAPTAESRAAILAAAVAVRGVQLAPQHLQYVAEKADGFDAADLEVLLDRALHIAVRRQLAPAGGTGGSLQLVATRSGLPNNGSGSAGVGSRSTNGSNGSSGTLLQLTRDDMEAALEGLTPAAFWGTGTRKAVQAGVTGWQDVGGMEEAREALHEALELPTKYARLVAQAPLRLRTGVLLYGPPGCGKTHIVAAAVAAANVRCITVSGPELLNKYIGASEAAVRDVFVRAAAAAPAVLFFDEFDAIAPQRGHDNTGVTDRVVNQLLTELDGVEGLRGVCVVAATSRPDLIDAALLRPGRLDRLVFCGFPSPLERGQVLRALARGVALAPDVDLDQVGYNAEFYSGADLSALLAEAQLAAVHEALEDAEKAQGQGGSGSGTAGPAAGQSSHARAHAHGHVPPLSPAVIQARHLEAALRAARPSVPEVERERLEAIYARFRQDREPGGLGGGAAAIDKGKGKLVSWA